MDKRIMFYMIGSAWIVGIGIRMLVEFLLLGSMSYTPNIFDIVVDWGITTVFGIVMIADMSIMNLRARNLNKVGLIQKVRL